MEPPCKKIKLNAKIPRITTFHDLPDEMIDVILSYCSIKDILKLSEVNKYWNSYIKTSQKLMKKITLTVTEQNYKEVANCTRLYQKLRLKSSTPFQGRDIKTALENQMESVRNLEIQTFNLSRIKFPNLRKMYLINENNQMNDEIQRIFSYYATQLEVLHLESPCDDHVEMAVITLKNLKALKTVYFTKECNTSNKSVIALDLWYFTFNGFNTFPNLQYLKVKHVTWEDIKKIFQYLPYMKRVVFFNLHVGYYYYESVEDFKRALFRFKQVDFDKENKTNIKFISYKHEGIFFEELFEKM